ncbi:E3 ubiquitin-protein ligase CHIP-like isoform X2 [Juglans regia]|uniref:E3 ubiquitin-protein ligase CHIP n=1 Tax=Juglans regia TaxID=51240 RepID=A0A6P9EFQ5_JUGRE|nr:E3 ubiquitin-protein ligase CHIP-like isoform X2 [Juglans regia]
MATCTSRKIVLERPSMLIPRRLRYALRFLCIGRIVLCAIASGSIDWPKVEEDCRRAIELDNNSLKAHYMLGLALLQRQEFVEGIKELQKALDLGRANPESNMVEEIWQEVAKAKYVEWENASSKRSWELQNLKEACEAALKEKHFLDDTQTEGFVDEFDTSHLEQLKVLRRVFREAAEADTPTEVPDYLCCKITLDILRDPVITPSGVTYEKAVILEHLQKVGKFDPITREPLNQSQLIPNLAIKEAVQAFLDKHGWAYKTD